MTKRPLSFLLLLVSVACSSQSGSDNNESSQPAEDTKSRGDKSDEKETICQQDKDCDDGLKCNGSESCAPDDDASAADGCVSEVSPCGEDGCASGDEDRCVSDCDAHPDRDGDGYASVECGGNDCDDLDSNRFPGNREVCDAAGHDEDCDEVTLGDDKDGDGFVSTQCCNTTSDGSLACGEDCNDELQETNPEASEICNRIDDNCNGEVDEELPLFSYAPDCDGDGFGDELVEPTVNCGPPETPPSCSGPGEWSTFLTDCDDTEQAANPGNGEVCDFIDNNCDAVVDEGPGESTLQTTCWEDLDRDTFATFGAVGFPVCGSCPVNSTNIEPIYEDSDCDDSDGGVTIPFSGRVDKDGDSYGVGTVLGCAGDDEFSTFAEVDCDDNDSDYHPGQTEFFTEPSYYKCNNPTYPRVCDLGDGDFKCAVAYSQGYDPIDYAINVCNSYPSTAKQPVWNYDCDETNTQPEPWAGTGSCFEGCNDEVGWENSESTQCGDATDQMSVFDMCLLSIGKKCQEQRNPTTLPCR